MTSLPIVRRELLVAARERMTYLSRTLTAGVLLAVFTLLNNLAAGAAVAGPHILSVLSTLVFIEAMLAGLRYTSDCISEERREGTLGLLFLTDLGGLDIVLGKLFARGLRAFYSLLAALPILALTLLLGGVTGAQVAALSITLVVCVLFSLGAGVFISSRGYRERNVLVGVVLFLVLMTFLPIAVNEIAVKIFGFYGLVDTLVLVSPYYAFSEAGRGFTRTLTPALWTLLALCGGFIFYAAWRTRRTFGEAEPTGAVERLPEKARGRARGRIAGAPLQWLAQRGRIRQSRVLMVAGFIICFAIFAKTAVAGRWNWAIPLVFLGSYGLHALYKFFITAETCRQLNEDRRSGALELLLVTPASPAEMARSQIHATIRKWLPVTGALWCLNFLWMNERHVASDPVIRTLLPVSLILLVSDTIVLPYRAALRALHGERYTLAVFKTYLRTQGPPLALIALMLGMSIGSTTPDVAENCFVVWTVVCVVYSVVLVMDARRQLKSDFRLLAAGESMRREWGIRRRWEDIGTGMRLRTARG